MSLEEAEFMYGLTLEEYADMYENPDRFIYDYDSVLGKEFKIVGSIPDSNDVEIVIADGQYDSVMQECLPMKNVYTVYTNDKEELKSFIENDLSENVKKLVNIMVIDTYKNDMDTYTSNLQAKFDSRIIVTITIFIVSMIILYFMMKANAVAKITDLGVYRLLGISKKSILGMFMLENAMLSTYTSLVGVLGTTIVTKFLSGIPALQMNVVFPWYAFVLITAFLYFLNIFIGVLPVKRILKLPPAQLAAKYDI